jgi:hypothetical protein
MVGGSAQHRMTAAPEPLRPSGRRWTVEYPRIAALVCIPVLIFTFFAGLLGKIDFVSFWWGARIAVQSGGSAAYDPALLQAAQGGGDFLPFIYPPPFLALISPLGFLPYDTAYFLWVAVTIAAYLIAASRLAPGAFWLIAAYPAALYNMALGQNGTLTAALLCGAAATLRSRPFVSGLLLGCFVIKPQLALLFPVAAIAGRHWRMIGGALTSGCILTLLPLIIFGPGSWIAFIAGADETARMLENHDVLWPLMISPFAAIRMAGGSLLLATGVQAIVLLAAIVVVYRVWRSPMDHLAKFSVLAVSAVLATPYALIYDLTILILPLCYFMTLKIKDNSEWPAIPLVLLYSFPVIAFFCSYGIGANLAFANSLALMVALLARQYITPTRVRSPAY